MLSESSGIYIILNRNGENLNGRGAIKHVVIGKFVKTYLSATTRRIEVFSCPFWFCNDAMNMLDFVFFSTFLLA